MTGEVHFYWDRRRTWKGAVVLATIGTAGLLLLFVDSLDTKMLGLLWFAVFAPVATAVYRRGNRTGPVVTVSDAGIFDRRMTYAVLPWDAISRVEHFEAESVPFVGLSFHNTGAALSNARPLVRLSAPLHRQLGFPAASINTSLLNGGDAELIAAIRRFRPSVVSQH